MKQIIKNNLERYPVLYEFGRMTNGLIVDLQNLSIYGLSFLFSFLPKKKNKIVIKSFYGRGYGNNSKYIVESLLESNRTLEIIWLVTKKGREKSIFPYGVKPVIDNRIIEAYHLATAKVWIDDCRKIRPVYKSRDQLYLQTWHSPLRLKKIEKDAEGMLSTNYVKAAKRDSKNIDLMISGCQFSHNIYRNSFWYEGPIKKTGTPRCGVFFKENKDLEYKVKQYFQIPTNSTLILYAPTFRKESTDAYSFDYEKVVSAFSNKLNSKCYLLVRLHPNVAAHSDSIKFSKNVINATYYDDMQELLCASEVLITDYSSSMFDMAIGRKKCFLYAPDIQKYLEKERSLYFDLTDLPFPLASNIEELVSLIGTFNEEDYLKKLEEFLVKIGNYEDGKASERIAKLLLSVLM